MALLLAIGGWLLMDNILTRIVPKRYLRKCRRGHLLMERANIHFLDVEQLDALRERDFERFEELLETRQRERAS